jgi:peroxiredoxin
MSCNRPFTADNYTAYFGGEIINPNKPYILFCKDDSIMDTIRLNEDNTFFIKFDSLQPGLYTFKNSPEYQYVYFDKNDSLMVTINSKEFDESIVFCGRGDEKNNFLMEMYLRNDVDKQKMFEVFDTNLKQFTATIDTAYHSSKLFYKTNKDQINWSSGFDEYAKASVNYHYYSKKELYPLIHKLRTGEDITAQLPDNFYDFRKDINLNNENLLPYSPYILYISKMLDNKCSLKQQPNLSDVDRALKTNITKLNLANKLINNQKIKNRVFNNIAFTYLLEDQNMVNNQKFFDVYYNFSTDKSQKNEIYKIGQAIQLLKIGKQLPNVQLIDRNGTILNSNSIINKKTVLFFWSENASAHLIAAHKKILNFKKQYRDYQFIGINLDTDQNNWNTTLSNYKFEGIMEYRCFNFEDIKNKWAITKIHRTIVLDADNTIKNAFTNIFEVDFEKTLK